MLIEFKVANFRSFREEQTLSLVASKDAAHPDNLIDAEKFNLLKVAALYGPNASGKSNLIKAMHFMAGFVGTSATTMNLGDAIEGVIPFRLDARSAKQPSSFSVTVLIAGTRYDYGFSVTERRVHAEYLNVCKPGGRFTTWLDRRFDRESRETKWSIRGPLKKDEKLLTKRTRENGLLLSRGAELNVGALTELYSWFNDKVWVYDLARPPERLMRRTARQIQRNSKFHERVVRLVRDADLGIADLSVEDEHADEKVWRGKGSMRQGSLLIDTMTREPQRTWPRVTSLHVSSESRGGTVFDFIDDESNGTQRFFAIVGPILRAVDDGEFLMIDELECSMHPLLTRKIVELFQNPDVNTKGAQLVFATHDSTLMDKRLFRRDQVWLTEKRRSGATEVFSLYDFKDRPRNTEALERNYLIGRYGAVPHFGPSLEDLDAR